MRTCRSLLARRGLLEVADPDLLTPSAFAAVRESELAGGRPMTTITAFVAACTAAIAGSSAPPGIGIPGRGEVVGR